MIDGSKESTILIRCLSLLVEEMGNHSHDMKDWPSQMIQHPRWLTCNDIPLIREIFSLFFEMCDLEKDFPTVYLNCIEYFLVKISKIY